MRSSSSNGPGGRWRALIRRGRIRGMAAEGTEANDGVGLDHHASVSRFRTINQKSNKTPAPDLQGMRAEWFVLLL